MIINRRNPTLLVSVRFIYNLIVQFTIHLLQQKEDEHPFNDKGDGEGCFPNREGKPNSFLSREKRRHTGKDGA